MNDGNDVEAARPVESGIPSVSKNSTTISSRRVSSVTDSNDSEKSRRIKRLRKKEKNADHSPLIKYGSLILLVAQLVGLVMLMRYSRTHTGGKDLYLSSTAVFCMEVLKFIVCTAVIFFQSGRSLKSLFNEMHLHLLKSPGEVAKVSVPSFLYVIQNNLLYLALSNLDAATYQVCYQLKILTTAVFSAVMLKRRFSKVKWFSVVLLTIGVAIVQTSGNTESSPENDDQNRTIGLIAILCAACTSGFSGVYFEKILKNSSTSLWIRNIQMGLPSVIISLVTIFIQDGATVREKGFFVGYSPMVWLVVIIQAVGGLIVAVVVKYADNVLKTFASSFGIVISCIISAILFDFHPNFAFLIGTALVVTSTVLYSQPEKRGRKRMKARPTLPK